MYKTVDIVMRIVDFIFLIMVILGFIRQYREIKNRNNGGETKKWSEEWLKIDLMDYEKTLIQLGFLLFILQRFVVRINAGIKFSDTLDPYQKLLYISAGRCIIAFLAGILATVSAYWLKSEKIASDTNARESISSESTPINGVDNN
ncbi:MAG: hypothetical protein GX061_03230 [Eubacteriaceae bacterium]|nr:hypothetical protein [Eubacteriaceae bacterium]